MMKKRVLSILLCIVMIASMISMTTLTAFAAHSCPDCEDLIDGSPYCDECYKCDACVDLCLECGKCTECSGSEICSGCSDDESGLMCIDCAIEKGTHCPNCDKCFFDAGIWCEDCGMCEDCSEYDECCSNNLGEGVLCHECAESRGSHCQGCGACYFEIGVWCEDCGLCEECSPYDEGCSNQVGQVICKECATYLGTHCPVCEACYFEVGSWCEECGQCVECSETCLYCCEEAGEVICVECAIDQGMHCPDCSECYGESGGEYCIECGICANCADICVSEEMCIDCAISAGYHCPSCEACGDDAVLCEGCGEKCSECSDAFCENCNMCDQCVLICQGCGSCEECAVICPGCEEYCSECEGICDDCELCFVCCADIAGFVGCDCGDRVCVESGEWDEHFAAEHSGAQQFGHNMRPSSAWDCDDTYHWHNCSYCNDIDHRSGTAKHTYDAKGKCTSCYYVKDAKIQIIVQPKDSKTAYVRCSDEDYDESNIARFSVVALGNSELTYTWCRKTYVQGVLTYVPLTNPEPGEKYTGPNLDLLIPEDACWFEYYICCFISDEEGNEVKTVDALLSAKHNYQYYEQWKSHQHPCEFSERSQYGHVLECVGTECEKVTHLRPHEDEDRNGYCDVCDYEIGKILITKQPKDVKNVYVRSAEEDYDESNIAHFSVEAEGESKLTYTWCRKQYVGGRLTYEPLTNPELRENYDGPNLDLLVPTDACCIEYTYACIITDEEGNETRTVDVVLQAKHNYQYYRQYQSHENPYPYAKRKYSGHILQCVGEECGKITRLRQHVDENHDYFCDVCDEQKDIMEIGLTVTVPKEGQLPNYNVGTESVAYFAMGGNSDYTQYRFWFASDNGTDNWKLIDKNTPFVAGKYYKFVVEMQTKSKYEFPTYNGAPTFWAKVNGDYVKPEKTYGMDPAHYVTVSYEFGICNDSIIENIVIENITTPIAGEKPIYTATVRGSGYSINSSKNEQLDDYWNNPQQKPYYIKNGIGWFDVTDGDWVYENETFIPGHEYQINVYLKTDDGYEFKLSKWLDIEFTASVNGFAAEGINNNSDSRIWQTISTIFACEGKKVTTVMVNGLSVPRAGEHPDYTANVAYPEWYRLDSNYAGTNGIVWFDTEGNQLLPEDTFVEGKKYKVEIKLISATLNGANTAQFVSPVAAYVNGKQVLENGDDMVYGNANTVYICYTFPKGAAAPILPTSVSGQIISADNANGNIIVQLIRQGYNEPDYETVVKGTNVGYVFADVSKGTYTLKVSKEGYVTGTATVVVDKDSVIQNVTLQKLQYTVTVTSGTASPASATPGTTVTLTAAAAPAGKIFDKWVVSGATVADASKATTSFIMPAGNVTATATYKNLSASYTVTFNTAGGSAVAAQTVQAGQKATKPAEPTRAGYDLAGWTLSGNAYNFDTPVNSNITLTANWVQMVDSSKLFVDVPAGAWYKEYVDYAATYKILNGAGNKMNPEANITRAEFVQVLANLSGVDTSDKDVPTDFTDVKRGEWYAPAIKWASENGIAGGMGGGKFAPNESITREQMCTMLVRYIENYLHKELKKTVSKKTFADDAKISDWAKEYVYDCQQAGLVNGVTATTFAPDQSADRASIATLMTRFHKNYMK